MIEEISDMPVVMFAATVVAGLLLYFLPTLVANWRDVPKVSFISVTNLVLGWTVVGWVVALFMALGGERGQAAGFHQRALDGLDEDMWR